MPGRSELVQRIAQLPKTFTLPPAEILREIIDAADMAAKMKMPLLEAEALLHIRNLRVTCEPLVVLRGLRRAESIFMAHGFSDKGSIARVSTARPLYDLGAHHYAFTVAQEGLSQPLLPTEDRLYAVAVSAMCRAYLRDYADAFEMLKKCETDSANNQAASPQALAFLHWTTALLMLHAQMNFPSPRDEHFTPFIPQRKQHFGLWPANALTEIKKAENLLNFDYFWPYLGILKLYCNDFYPRLATFAEGPGSIIHHANRMADKDPASAALLYMAHAMKSVRTGQATDVLCACGKALALARFYDLTNISRDILFLARQAHLLLKNSAAEAAVQRQLAPLTILPLMTGAQAEEYLHTHHPSYPPRYDLAVGISGNLLPAANSPSRLIRKALDEIDQLSGPELKVSNLVKICGVSRRTFEMAFRENLSRSIGEVLKERGLTLASRLASHTDLSVKDLAQVAGYRSSTTFARDFKVRYGKPPSVWRRM